MTGDRRPQPTSKLESLHEIRVVPDLAQQKHHTIAEPDNSSYLIIHINQDNMLLKIFDIYAFLTILTGTVAMACDGEDKFWSDIGDNSTVETVFAQVCSSMTSDDDTGYRVRNLATVSEYQAHSSVIIFEMLIYNETGWWVL